VTNHGIRYQRLRQSSGRCLRCQFLLHKSKFREIASSLVIAFSVQEQRDNGRSRTDAGCGFWISGEGGDRGNGSGRWWGMMFVMSVG